MDAKIKTKKKIQIEATDVSKWNITSYHHDAQVMIMISGQQKNGNELEAKVILASNGAMKLYECLEKSLLEAGELTQEDVEKKDVLILDAN